MFLINATLVMKNMYIILSMNFERGFIDVIGTDFEHYQNGN